MRHDTTAGTSLSTGGSFTNYHFASFAAAEVSVAMVPRFTMPRIATAFGGRFGPFAPNFPVDVPLWLALHIRQTGTCTISPPPFVAIPYLRGVVEREELNEATFEPLPFYFFELVKKLCGDNVVAEDIPHAAEVIRLVAEIKAIRRQKLQRSMAVFEAEGSPVFIPGIKLTNIVNHELEYLRYSFANVLKQSSDMKRRREKTIGAPIENITTPMRPSSGIAASSVRPSDLTMMSSVGGTPSVAGTLQSSTEAQALSHDAPLSVVETLDTTTTATELQMSSPPVKKRRTLRQT